MLNRRISAFHNACNHIKAFSETLKICCALSYCTARISFAEPGGNIRVVIIKCLKLLYIYEYHRNVQVPDCRKHVIGCGIGQQLHKHKINIRCTEFIPCSLGLFFCGDKPAVDHINRIGNRLFKCLILCLEFRHKGRELGQVSTQRNGKHTDSCFGID